MVTAAPDAVATGTTVEQLVLVPAGGRVARELRIDWLILASTALVILGVFCLQSFRLTRAPDVFVDEITYFYVGKSIAQGEAMRQYWFAPDTTFFWQPPLFFLLEVGVIKVFNNVITGPFAAIFLMRYLNVALAALTGGLLFFLGTRLHRASTGLIMGLLFALDPFILRSARRNLLEVTVMVFVVLGVLILQRFPDGLSRRGAVALGIIFGLVLLAKEVAFYSLALPALVTLIGQRRHFRRHAARLAGSMAVSLAVYGLYPLWSVLNGTWGEFLQLKVYQFRRFEGVIQASGWNRTVASNAGSRPPTFIEALGVNLPTYGTSYVLIVLGSLLGIYLLLRARHDPGARLLGSWSLINNIFFAYTIVRGQLNDQFFYLLLVPTCAVVGYTVPLLARALSERAVWPIAAQRPAAALVLAVLPGLCAMNGSLYYTKYAVGVDDGYRQVHNYLLDHVPPGSPLLIGSDTGIHVFPEYRTFLVRTPEEVSAQHIHYFVLSSKDAWGHYNGITPEFYDWVTANSVELFAIDEPTFWRLGVYYMAYPDEYRKTTSASVGGTEPPALTPVQLAARPIPPVTNTIDRRYFTATGHTISGEFKRHWESRGGLTLFGYPLSEPVQEGGRLVQYFERARLELIPEATSADRHVQSAPLGRELTAMRLGEEAFHTLDPLTVGAGRRYFDASGHSMGGVFRRYWEQYGGLDPFGQPISEELLEVDPQTGQSYTVQYFERARFEYHPENADTANEIILSQLGREALGARGVRR